MRRITALLFFVLLLLNSLFVFAETEAQADARQQNTSRHSVERAPMSVSKAKGPVYQVPATNPLAVGGVAYGQNAQTDAWLRISTLNPSGATTLGNTGAGSYYGGDFDDSGLFAAVDNDLDRLVVIDTASGLITAVGTAGIVTGDTWTGLTYDATDGTWYASSTNGVTSNFYTVNPATGAATLVGNNAALALVIDISASPTGEIWAHDIGLDAIYVMDKSTWAETLVGSTGFDANFAQGMDFDATSGELYLAAYNNTVSQGELRLVDQATGAAALVGTLGAGTGVEVGAFGFPGSAADDADPNPVTSAGAYSDYTTPSSISLTWDDPTTYFNGDPLPASDFTVEISRDGAALASVAGGVGAYDDNSVSDGTFYEYTLVVKVTATDSMSTEASTGWTAGGSPIPSVPMSLAITDPGTGQLQANWTNPSTNIDGTPMDDFAAINLYENGTLLATFTRATTDTGTADSDLFTPAAGTNLYRITAVDNEGAGNESAQSNAAYSPIGLPFQDEFLVAGDPNAGFWLNETADVTDLWAVDPVSPPYTLNMDGLPDGGDLVTLLPVDLSAAAGTGVALSYWYQPQGSGNAPEVGDSLVIEALNDAGQWVILRAYPGTPVAPFVNEFILLDNEGSGSGSFFHNAFQFRFRNIATASTTSSFDNWLIDNVFLGVPSADPVMVVDPLVLSDTVLVNGSTSVAFTILNDVTLPATLNYTVTDDPTASWAVSSPTAGALGPLDQQTVTVALDGTGLTAGTYTANIVVDSNDPVTPSATVAITFVVDDAPVVGFSPDSMSFGPLDPAQMDSLTLTISNTGAGPLEFTLTDEDVFSVLKSQMRHKDMRRYPDHFYGVDLAKGQPDTRRGHPVVEGQGGPDNFGYKWIDSNEPGGPTFNWRDISGSGTAITLTDDSSFPLTLPWTFEFYGDPKTAISIGSNGYLTFGTDGTDFSNDPIPDTEDPNDIIAVNWNDLNPAAGGSVYYLLTGDELIVQWDGVVDFNTTNPNTFQAIINSNGTMLFQYLDLQGNTESVTVGVENSDASDGLEVVFDAPYLQNNLAIRIAADSPWLSTNPVSGTVPAGGSMDVQVVVNTTGLLGGDYLGNVLINSNDPVTPVATLPVHMAVTGTPVIAVAPAAVDFPDAIFVGLSETRSTYVKNVGSLVLNVTDITSDNATFTASPTSFTVAPFDSVEVMVTFAPTVAQAETGTLSVASDDPATPSYSVAVSGTGVMPPVANITPQSIIVNLTVGDSTETQLLIENTAAAGAASLDWTGGLLYTDPAAKAEYFANNTTREEFLANAPALSMERAPARTDGPAPRTGSGHYLEAGGVGYGSEAIGDAFVAISATSPTTPRTIGTSGGLFLPAGDFDTQGNFLALDYDNNVLVSVDTNTAAISTIGSSVPSVGNWSGLTYNALSGEWWAVSFNATTVAGVLHTIDPATGAVTTVGEVPGSGLIIDMSFDNDGVLWGHTISTDEIIIIDPVALTFTTIGATGFDANFAQGMDFDPTTGDLYLAAYNNTVGAGELRLVDLATGATTLIGTIGAGAGVEVCAFGFPGSGSAPFVKLVGPTAGSIAPGDLDGFIVRTLALDVNDTTYYAWAQVTTNDPNALVTYVPIEVNVGVVGIGDGDNTLPTTFDVSQNYPNPFNPTTTISYQLPKASDVSLVIYNVLGQRIRSLVSNRIEAGHHQVIWDGMNDAGATVSSGIYIYRFEAGDFSKVQKMMLLK